MCLPGTIDTVRVRSESEEGPPRVSRRADLLGGAAVADEIVPGPGADPVIGATSYAEWEAGR